MPLCAMDDERSSESSYSDSSVCVVVAPLRRHLLQVFGVSLPNAEWQVRQAKRLTIMKTIEQHYGTEYGIITFLQKAGVDDLGLGLCAKGSTGPDPYDRHVSKRSWEKQTMNLRICLKTAKIWFKLWAFCVNTHRTHLPVLNQLRYVLVGA